MLALVLAVAAVGCAPKASFKLGVENRTEQALTVGIVKEGGSYERDLAGLEQWAIESDLSTLPAWGHVIPPGRTLDSPPVTGSFPQGTLAHLRVYRGEHKNSELMAISNPSPDRLEVVLFPGYNALVIRDDPKKGLVAERVRPARR